MKYIATIGVFDGVHQGHLFLLEELKKLAARTGLQPMAVAFSCSPSTLFCPQHPTPQLTTWAQKENILHNLGVSVCQLNFDQQMANLRAQDFLKKLHDEQGVEALLMGYDHRFGFDHADFASCQLAAAQLGMQVYQAKEMPGAKVSSTRIRERIQQGRMVEATLMLGRPYCLTGTIEHGYGNGQRIGFPTANLSVPANTCLPKTGVYVAKACWKSNGQVKEAYGVLNIGCRPTLTPEDKHISLELHLPGYDGSLYGCAMEIGLLDYLRPEQRFETINELKEQINKDLKDMKKIVSTLCGSILLLTGCGLKTDNPFFEPYTTRNGVPPFDKIKVEHFRPAFIEGMKQDSLERLAIANNTEEPTFENTIAALDTCGQMLQRVASVFFNLQSANTNDEMDALAEEFSPALTAHEDNMMMNPALFQRIKTLYDKRDQLNLKDEDMRLLTETYKQFVRSGALLNDDQKARLCEINKELSSLDVKFAQNAMKDAKSYQKFITDEKELAGLPQGVRETAQEAAKEAGKDEQWLFTLDKASFIPVLQYSQNRALRKELLLAYTQIANHGNDLDNKQVIVRTMQLRVEKAQLMGYKRPADFILDDCMAKTPEAVFNKLMPIWNAALDKAKEERADLQELMNQDTITNFNTDDDRTIKAWDWWYYAEQVRKQKYNLEEEQLKPYFELQNVRAGVFGLAEKLYGLKFIKLEDMPVWHEDVECFEVRDAEDQFIGTLYTDYFPRAGKRAGAWMDNITPQYIFGGVNHRPVIVNVGNLTKPTSTTPSLLTMDDVETMFHEFGHALHGLLSQCTYRQLSGTNVPRDFVEMPSQLMENWCWQPEVMKTYAKHYKTGEIMPDSLMQKIQNLGSFNQGFVMTELLSAALMDMKYHCIDNTQSFDVEKFEKQTLDSLGLIPEIFVRYRSTYFSHIFTTGYEAGYYSYTWANILDADVFQAFKESGDILNSEVAARLRHEVLERGNTDDPMKLYLNFRGKEPNERYLLEKKGLLK